jgi:hypothetical protein
MTCVRSSAKVRVLAKVGLCVMVLWTSAASAQDDRARARAEFDRGVRAYAAGDYVNALAAFQEAYRLQPHPAVRVNLANCYDHLDRPLEAMFHFERYLQEAGRHATREQRREVESALARLRRRVGEVTLRVAPDGALVTIDGGETRRAPIMEAVRLEAGTHRIETRLEGYRTDQRTVEVTGGTRREVDIRLERVSARVAATTGTSGSAPASGTTGGAASSTTSGGASFPSTGAGTAGGDASNTTTAGTTPASTGGGPTGSADATAEDGARTTGGSDGVAVRGDDPSRRTSALAPPDEVRAPPASGGLRITTPTAVAAAATGALLVAAIATGLAATGAASEFDDLVSIANDPVLPLETRARAADDGRAAADRANTLATVTDVLGVAALVGAGTTAALFLLAQGEQIPPTAGGRQTTSGGLAAAPLVGPGRAGLTLAGTF